MHLSRHLIALSTCALLAACGGGGEDSTTPTHALPTADALAEFEGIWAERPEDSTCKVNFPYNVPYFHRFRNLTLAQADGVMRATVVADVYEDAACTTKAGRAEERFLVHTLPGGSPGRSNVIRASFEYTGFSLGADGGSGVGLNRVPDGSLAGLQGEKFLMDRSGDQLFATHESIATTLDGTGYPTAILDSQFLVR